MDKRRGQSFFDSIQVGGGGLITGITRGMAGGSSVGFDGGLINANSKGTITVLVPGMRPGDFVIVHPTAALPDDVLLTETVIGYGRFTQTLYNASGSGIDPSAIGLWYLWFHMELATGF